MRRRYFCNTAKHRQAKGALKFTRLCVRLIKKCQYTRKRHTAANSQEKGSNY